MQWSRTPHGVRELKLRKMPMQLRQILSYPTRGTWVEISEKPHKYETNGGRTPHGVRELKYNYQVLEFINKKSYPTRGTWVEILQESYKILLITSYPTRGTWVEIPVWQMCQVLHIVVPHTGYVSWNCRNGSSSIKGIESYPTRGTWVEICKRAIYNRQYASYPTRGTWVEINKIIA